MATLVRMQRWFDRNAGAVVAATTLLAAIAFAVTAWVRYRLGDANGVDLGIYGQVLWNTAHGHPFAFTIHPHSYLGDHIELGLMLLAPFARAFGSLPTLLGAQALALASTGPIAFALARRYLPQNGAAVAAVLTLLSPFVANAALFEFHLLAFAVPVLLLLCLAYDSRNLPGFALAALATLFIREDLAPVIVGFGVLAAIQRRGWRWWLPAIGFGTAWFLLALKLTALFSGYAADKFLAYYAWLGSSPGAALQNLVLDPLRLLRHLFGYGNFAFVLGALGSAAFLPLAAPMLLLPVLPYAAQFLLGTSGDVALETHYSAPLVPFLLWATLAVLAALRRGERGWYRKLHGDRAIVFLLAGAVALYSAATLGPLVSAPETAAHLSRDPANAVRVALGDHLPPTAALAADFPFLAPGAERTELYSLHYEYRGRKQLSLDPYRIPASANAAAWDGASILAYQSLYPDAVVDGTDQGAERLTEFWVAHRQRTVASFDLVRLTETADHADPLPFDLNPPAPTHSVGAALGDGITFEGYDGTLTLTTTEWFGRSVPTLSLAFTLGAGSKPVSTDNLLLTARRGSATVWTRLVPVAYGFHPTRNWAAGERVRTAYALAVPGTLRGTELLVQLVAMDRTKAVLDGLRGLTVQVPTTALVGQAIALGPVR